MSVKILRGDVGTRHSLPACPVAIKNSRQPFLSGAGDSPINTDIPTHRAMHTKRALTLLEGVLVSIFSWVAMRTDMVKSATCLSPSLCLHLCAVKLGCWRCLRSHPPTNPPTPSSPSLPYSKGEDDPGVQEPDQNASLSPYWVNQSHRHWHRLHRRESGWDRRGVHLLAQAAPKATYFSRPYSLHPRLAYSLYTNSPNKALLSEGGEFNSVSKLETGS